MKKNRTVKIEKARAALSDTAHQQVKTRIGGRMVVVNALSQTKSGEWLMTYSHSSYAGSRRDTIEPGQVFTIHHF